MKDKILQIKIQLDGVKPPIWRRVLIESSSTLGDLHGAIQSAMGWENCHLHEFNINGIPFGPNLDESEAEDEESVRLAEVQGEIKYWYDFGDDWMHTVTIEKTVERESDRKYPWCIDGKRNCPPEDCGGLWGYAQFLETIANPKTEEAQDLLDWVGGAFDAEAFDLDEANVRLREKVATFIF